MRRTILMVATMALTLLVASGVAPSITKIGTDGPNTLRGTNGDDNLLGSGGKGVCLNHSDPESGDPTGVVSWSGRALELTRGVVLT